MKSFWIEDNLCFINTTEDFEFLNFPDSDDITTQNCSILAFDDDQGEFKNYWYKINLESCFENICSFDVDENQIVFNGTALICNETSHVGVATKSKYMPFTIAFSL